MAIQLPSDLPLKGLGMRSLLGGLLLRVGLGLALAMVAVGWLFWHTLDDVGNLAQDEMLRRQANDLLPALRKGRDGALSVEMSSDMLDTYQSADEGFMFVVHDGHGHVLKSSQPNAPLLLQKGLLPVSTPTFLNTEEEDGTNARYIMARPLWLKPRPVYLTVAQFRTIDDVLLEQTGREAMTDLLFWLVPCMLVGIGLVGSGLSQGLSPLRTLSESVRRLGTQRLEERLPTGDLPDEIKPLAEAANELREQLARVLASQHQLTGDMAHQLKTPLAIMQARLELLDPLPGRDDLLRDVQRLARLIQQMLHFSQLFESEIELAPLDLSALVREVVARLAPLADRHGVSLRYHGPDDVFSPARKSEKKADVVAVVTRVLVRGEPLLLSEAVQNLVDNAIQHTPHKGPKAKVDVEVKTDGTIEIRDYGKGVPALEKTMIFSRFWRSDDPDNNAQGSGLGLAIVAEIVRRHGGRVWVADQPDGGAVFSVALPVYLPVEALPA